jgi:hypothetical protein
VDGGHGEGHITEARRGTEVFGWVFSRRFTPLFNRGTLKLISNPAGHPVSQQLSLVNGSEALDRFHFHDDLALDDQVQLQVEA